MKDLTFGEQVKIILSRKGMTIKELAEQIQEETGKAMSRQNLTQRLGRDNFQEQDMRMIARILECPFRLSIFPTDSDEDFNIDEDALLKYSKKSGKKRKEKTEQEDEVYQQEFVFDETMTASVAEMPSVPVEDVIEEAMEEPIEEVIEEASEEPVEEVIEEAVEEPVEEIIEEASEDLVEEASEPVEEIEEPVKQDRFRTGAIFLRGFGRNKNKKHKKAEKVQEVKPVVQEEEPVMREEPVIQEEPDPVIERKPRPAITPDSEDFEPVVKHNDDEEDLNVGELNPYTGHEYQTNSVRMHPSKIGYVQVYDRAKHGWVDMTEWAFLGYQEEKKKVLGRNYEPPIYLD